MSTATWSIVRNGITDKSNVRTSVQTKVFQRVVVLDNKVSVIRTNECGHMGQRQAESSGFLPSKECRISAFSVYSRGITLKAKNQRTISSWFGTEVFRRKNVLAKLILGNHSSARTTCRGRHEKGQVGNGQGTDGNRS